MSIRQYARAGKHHRNVIFRNSNVPERAISSLDVSNAIDLWRGLKPVARVIATLLTIPHNPNKAWGLCIRAILGT